MADSQPGRLIIGIAQMLLVVAAAGLWAASRLTWVELRTFDGLGPPKSSTLSGANGRRGWSRWRCCCWPPPSPRWPCAAGYCACLRCWSALASLATGYLAVSTLGIPRRRRAGGRSRACSGGRIGRQQAALRGRGDHPGDRGLRAGRRGAVDAVRRRRPAVFRRNTSRLARAGRWRAARVTTRRPCRSERSGTPSTRAATRPINQTSRRRHRMTFHHGNLTTRGGDGPCAGARYPSKTS